MTLLVDGQPAPAGFNPASIPPEQILRAEVTERPQVRGRYQATVNIVRGAGTPGPSAAVINGAANLTADSVTKFSDGGMLWEGTPRMTLDKPVPALPATAPVYILVDGMSAPAGFDPGSLAPDALVRIISVPARGQRPATLNLITAKGDQATSTP